MNTYVIALWSVKIGVRLGFPGPCGKKQQKWRRSSDFLWTCAELTMSSTTAGFLSDFTKRMRVARTGADSATLGTTLNCSTIRVPTFSHLRFLLHPKQVPLMIPDGYDRLQVSKPHRLFLTSVFSFRRFLSPSCFRRRSASPFSVESTLIFLSYEWF